MFMYMLYLVKSPLKKEMVNKLNLLKVTYLTIVLIQDSVLGENSLIYQKKNLMLPSEIQNLYINKVNTPLQLINGVKSVKKLKKVLTYNNLQHTSKLLNYKTLFLEKTISTQTQKSKKLLKLKKEKTKDPLKKVKKNKKNIFTKQVVLLVTILLQLTSQLKEKMPTEQKQDKLILSLTLQVPQLKKLTPQYLVIEDTLKNMNKISLFLNKPKIQVLKNTKKLLLDKKKIIDLKENNLVIEIEIETPTTEIITTTTIEITEEITVEVETTTTTTTEIMIITEETEITTTTIEITEEITTTKTKTEDDNNKIKILFDENYNKNQIFIIIIKYLF